ncbi:unnamed protein product [Cercopithifilaria johnstoni]|uniref:Uncharacterized protein n=1 Tax=Cercopithifilaria johnstoni TaxID=2874296 RepID=A0A8J2MRF8_9BILA|nr:unnamed protein product [Cercopithifilaria johnstoni]
MACWIATLYGGPKRSNQAAVAIEHKIYCFGGCRCIHEESSDQIIETFGVHVLNTIDYRWKLVETTAFQPNLSEQLLDGSGKPYQAYGEIPPLRVGHTVVVHQGMVYMWGGCCPDTNMMCSKMYRFDPEQRIWSVIPSASDTPSPRARHTAVVYNDMMLVYGGIESDRTNGRTM